MALDEPLAILILILVFFFTPFGYMTGVIFGVGLLILFFIGLIVQLIVREAYKPSNITYETSPDKVRGILINFFQYDKSWLKQQQWEIKKATPSMHVMINFPSESGHNVAFTIMFEFMTAGTGTILEQKWTVQYNRFDWAEVSDTIKQVRRDIDKFLTEGGIQYDTIPLLLENEIRYYEHLLQLEKLRLAAQDCDVVRVAARAHITTLENVFEDLKVSQLVDWEPSAMGATADSSPDLSADLSPDSIALAMLDLHPSVTPHVDESSEASETVKKTSRDKNKQSSNDESSN